MVFDARLDLDLVIVQRHQSVFQVDMFALQISEKKGRRSCLILEHTDSS